MKEFELIARLTKDLATNRSVAVTAGDDCAALDLAIPGRWLLFKTDAVVEGIHFTREAAPGDVGHKALARCLSDIAAMSGLPTAALITLALPAHFDVAWVEGLYAGLNQTARNHEVAIAGGETTTNPERVLISVALIGTVEKSRCVRRSGAKAGDALFVTGELGGSLAGKHLTFEPRLKEARWLTEHFKIDSMIDLSDGLAGDLRHLLTASGVGAELLARAIPVSRAARLRARTDSSAKPPLTAALCDGEDFELLFSLPSSQAVSLADAWKKRFPELRLSCIGKITAAPGLTMRDQTGLKIVSEHGYVHFAKS